MILHLPGSPLRLPVPRLMPFTIAALAAVLVLKTTDLARYTAAIPRAASAGVMPEAQAAAPEPPSLPAAAPPAATPPVAASAPLPTAAPLPDAAPPPAVSDSERAILLDLRARRAQLDQRDAALAARESLLAAAEQKLEAQARDLAALQQKLQSLESARQQRQEAGWQGLVKLYEAMKPRDAAAIFDDLDKPVLLSVLDRMKEQKAAAILAAMNPDKAREVTIGLAKLRTSREAAAQAAPAGG